MSTHGCALTPMYLVRVSSPLDLTEWSLENEGALDQMGSRGPLRSDIL